MPHSWNERILILTKTYPNPSGKYRETTCVAGLSANGSLRRLYPLPFRHLVGDQQFEKWEWIDATIHKSTQDVRPESHQVHIETVKRTGQKVTTDDYWRSRVRVIHDHLVEDADELESRRQQTGETLGFIGPVENIELDIQAARAQDWTEDELHKLTQEGLFDTDEQKSKPPLRKLPFEFRYRYRISGKEFKHMVSDWEAGALYWKCIRNYGENWESKFRDKFEAEFSERDLYFLMGTIHQHPHVWLIVGLYYPPKRDSAQGLQSDLF